MNDGSSFVKYYTRVTAAAGRRPFLKYKVSSRKTGGQDMEHDVLLEMKNISKEFPGVKALDNVSLTVRRGTVHALMGENGAGKSTLVKCCLGCM